MLSRRHFTTPSPKPLEENMPPKERGRRKDQSQNAKRADFCLNRLCLCAVLYEAKQFLAMGSRIKNRASAEARFRLVAMLLQRNHVSGL